MIFSEDIPDIPVEILSVLKLKWGESDVCVKPRSYAALAFRVKGGGQIKASGQTFELQTGTILYLPAGIDYEALYEETETIVFHFKAAAAGNKVETYDFPHKNAFHFLFDSAYKAWQGKEPGYPLYAIGVLYQILARIRRETALQMSVHTGFSVAVELLNTEFKNAGLRIPDVCRRSGICETTFRSLFRQIYKKSPVQYLTERRIEMAQRLLLWSSCSVERAAVESGFADAKYFSRVVKKVYGCSPTDLRNGMF